MIGKKVTCIWAAQEPISMGERYEIVYYDKSNGLVKVIGDDGRETRWLLGSYFELSGEEILAIKKIEFTSDNSSHVIGVTVILNDNTQWKAKFCVPNEINLKENNKAIQQLMSNFMYLFLELEIHRLFYRGGFYSKFEKCSY